MPVIKLCFKDSKFVEEKNLNIPDSEFANLDINTDKKEGVLYFKLECSFIDKKIAERPAQGICKCGFFLESGERIGTGYKLIIAGNKN